MTNNSKKRGRPVGSVNQKITPRVKSIQLNKDIISSPIIDDRNPYAWVHWGKRNNYPTTLLEMYHNSVVHSACIDFIANAIVGDGVDLDKMQLTNQEEVVPNVYEDWNDVIHKLALDLAIFGGYAIQVIKNRDNKTYSFFHQPFSTVRFAKKDENGEIKKAYLCKDWTNIAQYKPVEIDILNYTDDMKLAMGKPYLMVYTQYNIFDEYYPVPHYHSAIEAIQGDIKLKEFDLTSILNQFTPTGILTLNPIADDKERDLVLKNIEATFTGSENANNLIITFRSSNEDQPVQFTPIVSNVDGVNIFADNNERNCDRILSAHRLSRGLIGLPVDDAGFSSEGAILEAQYNLAQRLLINGLRTKLIRNMNNIFKMNGVDVQIELKPLIFNLQDVQISRDPEQDVDTTKIEDNEDVTTNNIINNRK